MPSIDAYDSRRFQRNDSFERCRVRSVCGTDLGQICATNQHPTQKGKQRTQKTTTNKTTTMADAPQMSAWKVMQTNKDVEVEDIMTKIQYKTPISIYEDLVDKMDYGTIGDLGFRSERTVSEVGLYLRFLALANFYGDYDCKLLVPLPQLDHIWRVHMQDKEAFTLLMASARCAVFGPGPELAPRPADYTRRLKFTVNRLLSYFGDEQLCMIQCLDLEMQFRGEMTGLDVGTCSIDEAFAVVNTPTAKRSAPPLAPRSPKKMAPATTKRCRPASPHP